MSTDFFHPAGVEVSYDVWVEIFRRCLSSDFDILEGLDPNFAAILGALEFRSRNPVTLLEEYKRERGLEGVVPPSMNLFDMTFTEANFDVVRSFYVKSEEEGQERADETANGSLLITAFVPVSRPLGDIFLYRTFTPKEAGMASISGICLQDQQHTNQYFCCITAFLGTTDQRYLKKNYLPRWARNVFPRAVVKIRIRGYVDDTACLSQTQQVAALMCSTRIRCEDNVGRKTPPKIRHRPVVAEHSIAVEKNVEKRERLRGFEQLIEWELKDFEQCSYEIQKWIVLSELRMWIETP